MSISGVRMTGDIRILPVFEHRMLLYSFKEPPRLDLKLGVTGPAIGKMSIPEFDFLKRAIRTAITVQGYTGFVESTKQSRFSVHSWQLLNLTRPSNLHLCCEACMSLMIATFKGKTQ